MADTAVLPFVVITRKLLFSNSPPGVLFERNLLSPPLCGALADTAVLKRGVIFAESSIDQTTPSPRRRPPLEARQRGLMAHAESRRGRRAQPPGLGRGGTDARLFHAGRSSCGRCSIRRRPAPGRPVLGRGSWGRKSAALRDLLNPSPLGSVAQGSPSPLFQCSTLFQKCSSALEHGFTSVPIG